MVTLVAQIINKALPVGMQDTSTPSLAGSVLGRYIAVLWDTALLLGGLGVIAYLIMGGVTWIMAGGDKGKVESAKERITQAIIGFAVLFTVAAMSTFLGSAFGLDLLRPDFTNLLGPQSNTAPPGGVGGTIP